MGEYKPNPYQPKCVSAGMKLRYTSQLAAERMLAHIILHGSAKQVPRRAYFCEFCHGWHLTSQERRSTGPAVRSYPDAIMSPLSPPTVGGTEVASELS